MLIVIPLSLQEGDSCRSSRFGVGLWVRVTAAFVTLVEVQAGFVGGGEVVKETVDRAFVDACGGG